MDTTTTREEHPGDRGAENGAGERHSEEWFRHLADAMPQLVWTAEPDGTVDYYNQRVH